MARIALSTLAAIAPRRTRPGLCRRSPASVAARSFCTRRSPGSNGGRLDAGKSSPPSDRLRSGGAKACENVGVGAAEDEAVARQRDRRRHDLGAAHRAILTRVEAEATCRRGDGARAAAALAATPRDVSRRRRQAVAGASLHGWKAVAVPGSVLGLDTALEYGTMPRHGHGAAIALARRLRPRPRDADIPDRAAVQKAIPPRRASSCAQTGRRSSPATAWSSPTSPRRCRRSPTTARTPSIAADPAGGRGRLARRRRHHHRGRLRRLSRHRGRRRWPAPIAAIASSRPPPPSSGGATLCEILNILEGYDLRGVGFHSAAAVHLMTEAMRHAFFDRNTYLGDPAFVSNPLDRLLSQGLCCTRSAPQIGDKATPSAASAPGVAPPRESETTHYSVIDKDGRRGRRHLYDQRRLRRRRHRRRHRLPAERRDGRLHRQARRRQPCSASCRARPTPSRPASGRCRRWRRRSC